MDEAVSLKEAPILNQDTLEDASAPVSAAEVGSGGAGMFRKRAKTSSAQKGLRKPTASMPSSAPATTISDDDSEDGSSDEDQRTRPSDINAGRKRKRGGIIQTASLRKPTTKEDLGVSYGVSKPSEAPLDPKNQATAVSAEFSEAELLGRGKSNTSVENTSDNLYRGQKGYRTLVPKREQITTKYNSMGPQKAASNIRMTTVTDYAPGMTLPILED
jgi:hypothetical protein